MYYLIHFVMFIFLPVMYSANKVTRKRRAHDPAVYLCQLCVESVSVWPAFGLKTGPEPGLGGAGASRAPSYF